jgi:2-keto-4-pentenoate hydratase/2-oxohepta-3-ene-1,7-dioic acid hydratase in catechol pathway
MKLAKIQLNDRVSFAQVEGDTCRLIDGCIFSDFTVTDETVALADAKLLAPTQPRQLVAIGLNYKLHAEESGMALPDHPLIFVKTPNCVVGPGEDILLPKMAPDEVDYECELVIVIGKEAKNVSVADAADFVLGYTCGNDVSARDCQLKQDKQWARGKSFDTFAPLGPWIETDMDPDNVGIRLSVNGEERQNSNTSDLIFPCMELVSYVSQCMTLYPGSIIMTGTPSGIAFAMDPQAFLKDGDTVTVEIDGIGALTNPVGKE